MPKFSNHTKDAWGAFAVATMCAVLFIAMMGSITMMGQATGQSIRTQMDGTAVSDSGTSEVPVLCYHYIRGNTGPLRVLKVLGYVVLSLPLLDDMEIWTQTENAFEKQMAYLHDNGYNTVTLEQIAEWRAGRLRLPENPVAITFDDGDRSIYTYGLPILKKYGFTATVFVVTDKVNKIWDGIEGLSWAELRKMKDSGVFTIESHTSDLHYKVRDDDADWPVFIAASRGNYRLKQQDWRVALSDDFKASREMIKRELGTDSRFIAWPYGSSNEVVNDVAYEAGFSYSVTMENRTNRRRPRIITPEWKRSEISRYAITARTSMRKFRSILAGTAPPTL
jgi:peptidoglycan/xylan/chitin deacetylase (PgdA/CDA1 family)